MRALFMHVDVLTVANAVVGVVAGSLACARRDRLVRYQAALGVPLIALGVVELWRVRGHLGDLYRLNALWGLAMWAMLGTSIVLGALSIAHWLRPLAATKKLVPWLGALAIAAGCVVLLFELRVLKFL